MTTIYVLIHMHTPQIIRTNNFGTDAAAFITRAVQETGKSCPVVCLPSGMTPLPVYKAMREAHRKIDLHYVALDEYIGLETTDERLFSNWLAREILDPLNIPKTQRTIFHSMHDDTEAECTRMKAFLKENPLDIAVIGIGVNGHIGFNEPPSTPSDSIRTVSLCPITRQNNAAYWEEGRVPKQAFTLGLKEILSAKTIILLATGEGKADIIRKTFDNPVSETCPASFLQEHPNVILIGDTGALSQLS